MEINHLQWDQEPHPMVEHPLLQAQDPFQEGSIPWPWVPMLHPMGLNHLHWVTIQQLQDHNHLLLEHPPLLMEILLWLQDPALKQPQLL